MGDAPSNTNMSLLNLGGIFSSLSEDTREKIARPLAALGDGLGRLIESKFEKSTHYDREKMADMLDQANKRSGPRPAVALPASGRIVDHVLNEAIVETDDNLRELWTNLLANEIQTGGTHPEFVDVLRRMNSEDAHRLVRVAKAERKLASLKVTEGLRLLGMALDQLSNIDWQGSIQEAMSPTSREGIARARFIDEHLVGLGLIVRRDSGSPSLTYTGRELLRTVSDPSIVAPAKHIPDKNDQNSEERTPNN